MHGARGQVDQRDHAFIDEGLDPVAPFLLQRRAGVFDVDRLIGEERHGDGKHDGNHDP